MQKFVIWMPLFLFNFHPLFVISLPITTYSCYYIIKVKNLIVTFDCFFDYVLLVLYIINVETLSNIVQKNICNKWKRTTIIPKKIMAIKTTGKL